MPHRERIRARLAAEQRPAAAPFDPLPRLGAHAGWILFAAGFVGVALAVALLWFSMRDVLDIGGVCASGGPYEIRNQCPEGAVWIMPLSIGGGFLFTGMILAGAAKLDPAAPGLALIGWPLLFLSLGWNFFSYGIDPPSDDAFIWSWLLCGVIFLALGLPALWQLRTTVKRLGERRGALLGTAFVASAVGILLALWLNALLT